MKRTYTYFALIFKRTDLGFDNENYLCNAIKDCVILLRIYNISCEYPV